MSFIELIKLLKVMLICINKLSDLGLIQCKSFRIKLKVMLDNMFNSIQLSLNIQLMGSLVGGGGNKVSVGELMEEFSDGL
jgi:hypothetical protein